MKDLLISNYAAVGLGYFLAITSLLLVVVYIFRSLWTNPGVARNLLANISTVFFSTLYILVLLETIFAYAFIQSDGFGFTLASQRWFYRHWNPVNTYGYRDTEPEWKDEVVFVVGDSFVAGHGIENIDDRFSNQLGASLGNKYTVTVLAGNGWNTGNYLSALKSHPQVPDKIIISYFLNDIQGSALNHGVAVPQLRKPPNRYIRPLVNHSYLINWLYWKLYRSGLGSEIFWGYLKQAYNDPDIWKDHTLEIDAIIHYADRINAEIAFIVWPHLADITGSAVYTGKVNDYLKNNGVGAIDLSTYLSDYTPGQLTVNTMDSHPGKTANKIVADLLYSKLFN